MGRTMTKANDEMMQVPPAGLPIVALGADDKVPDAQLEKAAEVLGTIDADENFPEGSTDAAVKMIRTIKKTDLYTVERILPCSKLQKRGRREYVGAGNLQWAQIEKGAVMARASAEGSREMLDAAAERYRQNAIAALRSSVAERLAPEAEKLASAAAEACVASQKGHKRAHLASAYSSLTNAPKTLEDALAFERFAQEIKNKGIKHLFGTYSAMLDVGDEEQLIQLEDASESWLREVVSTPAARLAQKHINARTDSAVEEEQSKAIALLAQFMKQREARIPRGLRIAEEVFAQLIIPAFAGIIGINAWNLSRDHMDRILNSDSAKSFDTFDIAPDWYMRRIDGRASKPRPSQESGGGSAMTIPGVARVYEG